MGDAYFDKLERERKEKEEIQKNIMNSEVDNRRIQLLDLLNKEMENIKVKMPKYRDLFEEAVHMNNALDNFTKGKDKKYGFTFLLKTF